MSHALCERRAGRPDAVAAGPEAHRGACAIDRDSFDDALAARSSTSLHAARFAVAVWDITSVSGCRRSCAGSPIATSAGTAPPRQSTARSIPRATWAFLARATEAVQSRLTQILRHARRHGPQPYCFDMAAERTEQPVNGAQAHRGRTFATCRRANTRRSRRSEHWLLERIRSAGLENAIVVNLTAGIRAAIWGDRARPRGRRGDAGVRAGSPRAAGSGGVGMTVISSPADTRAADDRAEIDQSAASGTEGDV